MGQEGQAFLESKSAACLTKYIDPQETAYILTFFYRDFEVKTARTFRVCPFPKYIHVITTNQKTKMVNP